MGMPYHGTNHQESSRQLVPEGCIQQQLQQQQQAPTPINPFVNMDYEESSYSYSTTRSRVRVRDVDCLVDSPSTTTTSDHNVAIVQSSLESNIDDNSSSSKNHNKSSSGTQFLPYSTLFDLLDCVLLYSCFRGVPIAGERSQHLGRREKVTIKVEATIVRNDSTGSTQNKSSASSSKAISTWRKQFDLDARLNESTFVGIVESMEHMKGKNSSTLSTVQTPTGTIQKGTLVTSIRKCATKARIATLSPEDIISLSAYQELDSGEVVALVSTYLPAFGALYHGIDLRSRNKRFSGGSLSNCEIMVSGGSAVESEAVIKLALMGGASRIFVSRPPSSGVGEYLKRMNSHKIVVLDGDPNSYRSRLHQKIDVIIDLGYLKDIDFLKLALVPKGRLVCVVPRNKSKNLVESVTEMLGQATLIKHPGTSVYDFEEMSKSNYKEVVRDLHYLLDLTQKRRLRPKVDRYIKARDVEIMLEDMAIRPPRGAVICEPWREFVHEPEPVPSIKQRFQEFCSQSLLLES